MKVSATLSVTVALLLAAVAAVVSSDRGTRQEMASFVTEALKPQLADLGDDPVYLTGVATVTPAPTTAADRSSD